MLCVTSISAQTTGVFELRSTLFCGGDGTATNPYQICTAEDLAALATMVNGGGNASQGIYYIVMNNLDLSDYTSDEGWIPIGADADNYRFQGNFNGNGKVVNNLVINRREPAQGLFGCTMGATIKNLSIENCDVIGDESAGGMVGIVYGGTITNCHSTGIVIGGYEIGGIYGYSNSLSITNCSSACTVSGNSKIGGLAGNILHSSSPMTNCYATGNVSGISSIGGLAGNLIHAHNTNCYATGDVCGSENIGGLAGNSSASSNTNCYAGGNITGTNIVGGLLGSNNSNSSTLNCYATGDVTATGNTAGGLTGFNGSSIIENCSATGTVSGADNVGGLVGENSTAPISNCYAFNCKVESMGTEVGRITGNNAINLTDNYGYNQMKLWANGAQVTPTPNPNGLHGAEITFANAVTSAGYPSAWFTGASPAWTFNYAPNYNVAPETNLPILTAFNQTEFPNAVQSPQIRVCGTENAVFFANDIYYESLDYTIFCDSVVHFRAEIAGFNAAQDSIKWFFDDTEYLPAQNLLQWNKTFGPGAHNIQMVMQVRFENDETLSISAILHVRVFWTSIKNYRY